MKKRITSLMLILVVAVSMTMGASAASYIPDDVTYQNLNGQQLAIKTYTLLPDQDPSDLYEDDFEYDGFLYSMALGMASSASAADYSFETSANPVYYGSTNYEDLYDAGYNYGARNQIDYDVPEIQYGLSQEFLETSLNNPYLSSGIQYGLSGGSATTVYPESDFSNSSIISGGSLIEVPYQPSVTITDLKQKDGSIGKVSIDRVSLSCKVYEGATDSSMSKGAGHYTSSGIYTGNIGLFGHNRGSHAYFAKLKNVKIGDIVEYKTAIGTKTYQVTFVGSISYTDYSYLNEMGDNRITLITCIANQPSLRLCVQAVEIR